MVWFLGRMKSTAESETGHSVSQSPSQPHEPHSDETSEYDLLLLSATRDLPDPGALAFRDPDEMILKPDSKACPLWMPMYLEEFCDIVRGGLKPLA